MKITSGDRVNDQEGPAQSGLIVGCANLSMSIRVPLTSLFVLCVLLVGPMIDGARASVVVRIQLSHQTMNVAVDGTDYASWPVSTARRGYRTPVGTYTPYQLEIMHYSRLYDYTPMPYSIFFNGGYAIHGTAEVRNLGRPVSHGCVRLSRNNARALFELVQSHGRQNTTIEIVR